jgi:hypothetical protein
MCRHTTGPEIAFKVNDKIHLTDAAYLLFAQRAFDTYRVALVPEPTSITTLLLAAVGMIGCRRRRELRKVTNRCPDSFLLDLVNESATLSATKDS